MKWQKLKWAFWNFFWQDWVTWIGHGLQGLAACAVAYWLASINAPTWVYAAAALLYFFGPRETPGIFKSAVDGDKPKLVDGIMDLVAPFIGLAVYLWVT